MTFGYLYSIATIFLELMHLMQSITANKMRSILRAAPKQPIRTFTTARPLRLKEDEVKHPEEAERAKQNQHHDKEERRKIGSSSEDVVGADRENVKDDKKHVEELQKQTAQETQKNHPEAK